MISDHSLASLLPRGIITWQNGRHESTVDLVLASKGLTLLVVVYKTYLAKHSSNHQAIETTFDVIIPEHIVKLRILFKNAP
jgi:hypothetical protein